MNKEIDLEADTIKLALMNNSHSFTATHNTWSQVSSNELANGNGYTTGGQALASKSVTQGSTTVFDANDSVWTSSSFTAYHGVLYDDTHATDDLLCSIDFGGAVTVSNGTLTVQYHASGILAIA